MKTSAIVGPFSVEGTFPDYNVEAMLSMLWRNIKRSSKSGKYYLGNYASLPDNGVLGIVVPESVHRKQDSKTHFPVVLWYKPIQIPGMAVLSLWSQSINQIGFMPRYPDYLVVPDWWNEDKNYRIFGYIAIAGFNLDRKQGDNSHLCACVGPTHKPFYKNAVVSLPFSTII